MTGLWLSPHVGSQIEHMYHEATAASSDVPARPVVVSRSYTQPFRSHLLPYAPTDFELTTPNCAQTMHACM